MSEPIVIETLSDTITIEHFKDNYITISVNYTECEIELKEPQLRELIRALNIKLQKIS